MTSDNDAIKEIVAVEGVDVTQPKAMFEALYDKVISCVKQIGILHHVYIHEEAFSFTYIYIFILSMETNNFI